MRLPDKAKAELCFAIACTLGLFVLVWCMGAAKTAGWY